MNIEYTLDVPITADQFIALVEASSLGERRPIRDRACMEGMILNSNLMITAWDAGELVGLARSMTDFHYACYLSDLAVSQAYQNQGIGRQLQILTQHQLGQRCKLILISAPNANDYYAHIGFTNSERCWVLERTSDINGNPATL